MDCFFFSSPRLYPNLPKRGGLRPDCCSPIQFQCFTQFRLCAQQQSSAGMRTRTNVVAITATHGTDHPVQKRKMDILGRSHHRTHMHKAGSRSSRSNIKLIFSSGQLILLSGTHDFHTSLRQTPAPCPFLCRAARPNCQPLASAPRRKHCSKYAWRNPPAAA